MNSHRLVQIWLLLVVAAVFSLPVAAGVDKSGWKREEVDWRITGRGRVRAIHRLPEKRAAKSAPTGINVIDSPPLDGFISWVAVAVTDASTDFDFFAYPEAYVTGNFLTLNPETDYGIGIFDTGAAASIMGNDVAATAGIFDAGLDGPATVEIAGVTGSVEAKVSYPLGLFIDGLDAIEPISPSDANGLLDTSGMVGQSNASIALGQIPQPGAPDLPTAIGSPVSVYFAADFRVDQQITVTKNSEEFSAPKITFYEHSDPCVPSYPNKIALELRPGGGAVAYMPGIDPCSFEFYPSTPSVIIGDTAQSLFFFPEVDLANRGNTALAQDEFIFDTGAQLTVIGTSIVARLHLGDPNFEVEVQGINGQSVMVDGFYIDSIEIPATGQWLSFTNVPVIHLDIASPEGGFIDGVIGMNLFVDYNFVFNGNAFEVLDPPYIEFEPIPEPIIADIAPEGGDHKVNLLDLLAFAHAWLATEGSGNWNPACDLAPQPIPDGKINGLDFSVLAQHWLEGVQ
ncbi:MAG: hypothetical protein DRP65_11155 [Planctomycetota bacterium]|nr:MAG: hypothetical protein DRP65_11155 [Planctomycetota bacterium]